MLAERNTTAYRGMCLRLGAAIRCFQWWVRVNTAYPNVIDSLSKSRQSASQPKAGSCFRPSSRPAHPNGCCMCPPAWRSQTRKCSDKNPCHSPWCRGKPTPSRMLPQPADEKCRSNSHQQGRRQRYHNRDHPAFAAGHSQSGSSASLVSASAYGGRSDADSASGSILPSSVPTRAGSDARNISLPDERDSQTRSKPDAYR
jgi:hypothetical protein